MQAQVAAMHAQIVAGGGTPPVVPGAGPEAGPEGGPGGAGGGAGGASGAPAAQPHNAAAPEELAGLEMAYVNYYASECDSWAVRPL